MERIPILQLGANLLVSIQVDLHDNLALALQDDLCARVAKSGAKGVLIDISSIAHISGMARILDARTVLVGMRPAVAITLVELGVALAGVNTARDVDSGIRLLARLAAEAEDASEQE
jgi:rsbT antagonist protein RsbS